MTTQAYSYLRVSSSIQVQGDGLQRQRDAIARYANAHQITIEAEYRDEAVSGTKDLGKRKGLAALLDAVESDGVRLILIERADRLARDLMVGEIILSQIRNAGARVVVVEGDVDLTANDDDPTKKLIRQILGAVAEYDKSITVLKLLAARERMRRETGRCEGQKPFGVRPGEQDTINRMKALRRKPANEPRMGYHTIAKTLNSEGRPTRTGKPWSAMTVKQILDRSK